MQHLMLEALGRLVDEAPDETEAAHLRECESCRAELEAMRRDTAALARLGPIEPAPADWSALLDRLERERLVGRRSALRFRTSSLLKLAAALALYGVGTATGLGLRARTVPPPVAATAAAPAPIAAATPFEPAASAPDLSPAPTGAAPEGGRLSAAAEDAPAARNVADFGNATTPREAARSLQLAERAYLQAYARYAELTSSQQSEDPVARVAALESIVLTTRQALDRAPADPLINGYHLTAVAQRDAALRQIALRSSGGWF